MRGAARAAHHLGDLSGVLYLGPGLESALVRASDTGVYWYLSLARELVPSDTRDPAAILAHLSSWRRAGARRESCESGTPSPAAFAKWQYGWFRSTGS